MPDLLMGIDVDESGTGQAVVNLQTQLPQEGMYSVGGYFVVWYGDQTPYPCVDQPPKEAIATIAPSDPIRMDANGQTQVKLAIKPNAYGDRLDYKPGIHMGMILAFFYSGPPAVFVNPFNPPTIMDGSVFQLPLSEYHDKVTQYFQALSGVDLYATTQQAEVNAGKTALFEVTAEMVGQDGADFNLELAGSNTAWAHVVGATSFHLSAGEKRAIDVAVTVPTGTPVGTVADLTLHAVKSDDSNVRSLIRLLATVTDKTAPDASDQVAQLEGNVPHKSPDAGVLVMLCLAGVAMIARRRKA